EGELGAYARILEDLMPEAVGVDETRPALHEGARHARLSGPEAARQADDVETVPALPAAARAARRRGRGGPLSGHRTSWRPGPRSPRAARRASRRAPSPRAARARPLPLPPPDSRAGARRAPGARAWLSISRAPGARGYAPSPPSRDRRPSPG